MSDQHHIGPWIATHILVTLVFYGALVWDLIDRWGGPLILEVHFLTVVWIIAYLFRRVTTQILTKYIHEATEEG